MPTARRPLLRPGDGIDSQEFVEPVQLLQRIMIKLRLLPISQPINGRFDSALEKAVKVFQMQNDLKMTGIVGAETWAVIDRKLGITPAPTPSPTPSPSPQPVRRYPVLQKGDGIQHPDLTDAVKTLQELLVKARIFPQDEIIDGKFGNNTEAAVRRFQSLNNLLVDGVVGRETWSALVSGPVEVYEPERQTGLSQFDVPRIIASIPYPDIRAYARDSVPLILQSCLDYGVTDLGQIAYVLATAEHESHLGKWMTELASGWAYEWRSDLGNIYAGDGPRYKGRGFVQITGRANYRYWSGRLGIDLIGNPELAANQDIAADLLVLGMRDGSYTGHSLNDHILGSRQNFVSARRIVNWLDRAEHIAAIAREFLRALR
ncbi:MAG: hypothetical protein EA395_03105 [Phormidium sp. GEM2.Bin31]|nr:peptidoglycan-binding protein [Phormidium sp. BM_Day4_Bin.17]TVR14124.1 MAG: hypothetical protein EA395_03105 [Phormidium sp. GEM2.Bin31]UCJ11396.1 MAG: peptidoglycan-binding protein [Phormidium sp. PBR-2020]